MRSYSLLGQTGNLLLDSYFMALASAYVYDSEQLQDWACFSRRFSSDYSNWLATENSTPVITPVRNTGTSTQLVVMSNDQSVIVVFRGTEWFSGGLDLTKWDTADWSSNLQSLPTVSIASRRQELDVRVHSAWWANLASVYDELVNAINNQGAGEKRLYITGHSLGAALAVLAAYRLKVMDGIAVDEVYTFASPKVGNRAFRWVYDNAGLGEITQRWVNYGDPAPFVPGAVAEYDHVGKLNNIYLDRSIRLDDTEMINAPTDISAHNIDSAYSQYIFNALEPAQQNHVPLAWLSGLGKVAAGYLASENKAYFFDGEYYSRYTPGEGTDWNYPRKISEKWTAWPASWASGFDAVMPWPNGKVYFFRGATFLRYTPGQGVDAGYPRPVYGNWQGWPTGWETGIDAAFYLPDKGKAYFFRDSEYLRYTPGQGVDNDYPKKIVGNWINWPGRWAKGVDTGLLWTNDKIYFFRGNEYIRYTPGQGVDTGYPKSVLCYWKRLLHPPALSAGT